MMEWYFIFNFLYKEKNDVFYTHKLRNQLKTLISKQTTSVDLERPCEVIVKDGKMKVYLCDIYTYKCV